MKPLEKQERQYLLNLARKNIESVVREEAPIEVKEENVPTPRLTERLASFVTLTLDGRLRGCIGHIEAIQPLYLDVLENSGSAAVKDPRFLPVSEEELKDLSIEISVLTKPSPIGYSGKEDLLKNIEPRVDGIVIWKGLDGATYLPSVWEQIKTKEDFLSSLCEKAGLPADEWEKGELEVSKYQVEKIDEGGK